MLFFSCLIVVFLLVFLFHGRNENPVVIKNRLEQKLSHLQKQAAFKTEATAGELDAVRTAIAEKEGQWLSLIHI